MADTLRTRGFVRFYNGTGAANNPGQLLTSGHPVVADMSAEWRVECTSIRPPSQRRASSTQYYTYFDETGVRVGMATDNQFPTTTTVPYSTLEADGFPEAGELVQIRGAWDADTDTLAWWWRDAGTDLVDDTEPWNLGTTRSLPGEEYRSSATQWRIGGDGTQPSFEGDIFAAALYINGVLVFRFDGTTDIVDPEATTITPTVGPGMSVLGSAPYTPTLHPATYDRIGAASATLTLTAAAAGKVRRYGTATAMLAASAAAAGVVGRIGAASATLTLTAHAAALWAVTPAPDRTFTVAPEPRTLVVT